MGTKVFLNVYDLTPANDCLYPAGFGVHHTGVEVMGSEYSFASGGGVFESTPKEAPGAKFRESLDVGSFEGGSAAFKKVLDDLRSEFGPNNYNILTKNCNHFSNALVWALLRRQVPSHINRLAQIGSYFSFLFPKKMLEGAPVGDSNGGATGFQVQGGGRRSTIGESEKRSESNVAFSGHGSALGTSSTSEGNANGFFGSIGKASGGSSSNRGDDLTDRRERARKAALARLDRSSSENSK